MTTILEFLKHPLWLGAPAWAWLAMALGVVVEGILGHAKNPRFRSLAATLATGLRALLMFLRIGSIPVVGPIIIGALEAVAGIDLDGDGKVGGQNVPPAGPAIALLAALAIGVSGCATTTQIVKDVEAECPQVASEAAADFHIIETIIMCDGGSGASLPACALASLTDIAAAIPGGWSTIQCVADVIAKDTSKPAAVRARASALREHAIRARNGR